MVEAVVTAMVAAMAAAALVVVWVVAKVVAKVVVKVGAKVAGTDRPAWQAGARGLQPKATGAQMTARPRAWARRVRAAVGLQRIRPTNMPATSGPSRADRGGDSRAHSNEFGRCKNPEQAK